MKTDTPRSDFHRLVDNSRDGSPAILVEGCEVVTLSFAKQLEREIAQLNQRLIDRTEAYEKKDAEQVKMITKFRIALELIEDSHDSPLNDGIAREALK